MLGVASCRLQLIFTFKMSANKSRINRTCFGVLVCHDDKKFGGIIGMGKRYIDVFGNKSNPEQEEWLIFSTVYGELPSEKDLDTFTGFFISGSPLLPNEDLKWKFFFKWINDLKTFIRRAFQHPAKPRIVGVCFGHQVIASALGGKVTSSPSKKFVLQSEKIKSKEHFRFQGHKAFRELFESHDSLRLLESHRDFVEILPAKAVSLASSTTCEHEMVQFTENIFEIQAHPEFNVQDYKEVIIPGMLARGKIDQKGQRFCEETLNLPLDSVKVLAALKKFASKEDT